MQPIAKELFEAFSLGDIKRIDSTPDHKPPQSTDSIEGRYSAVLFMSASKEGKLFDVYEDITFIQNLYKNSETFKMFTSNQGVGSREIKLFNEAL